MQIIALVLAGFVVALAVASVRSRRNIRSCCNVPAARDLRMRDLP